MTRRIIQKGTDGKYTTPRLAKGLKMVHIGTDVWKIGKPSEKEGKMHQVIYGPDDKEYHLYDTDVKTIEGTLVDPDGNVYVGARHGNNADQAKVKVYILTTILDKRENWCFDLEKIPANGKLKVIYSNGTVKNIDFTGEWVPELIGYTMYAPMAYRIK